MPFFKYTGYKNDGKNIYGTIEASSKKEAVLILKEKGIFLTKLKEIRQRKIYKKIPLVSITRHLSTLINSGISVVDSLKILSQESNEKTKALIDDIRDKVLEGTSFSKALKFYNNIFPDFYINMVKSAEESGTLPQVLESIAHYLETQQRLRAKLITAMIYPTVMLFTAIVVLIFIFIYVMPNITKIFEDTGAKLPFLTVTLLTFSKFIKNYWFMIPLILILPISLFRFLRKKYRLHFDRFLLNEPTKIFKNLYLSRITYALAIMLDGGVPLIKALNLAKPISGNYVLEKIIEEAATAVSEGKSLSSTFKEISAFLGELIENGEKTGKLVENLKRASRSFEETFYRSIDRAVAMVEPMIIVSLGFIVLMIVLGIVLPIVEINQLIKF